jgi:hypothetical protein
MHEALCAMACKAYGLDAETVELSD